MARRKRIIDPHRTLYGTAEVEVTLPTRVKVWFEVRAQKGITLAQVRKALQNELVSLLQNKSSGITVDDLSIEGFAKIGETIIGEHPRDEAVLDQVNDELEYIVNGGRIGKVSRVKVG